MSTKILTVDAAVQKKIYGPGTTAFINSNEEMEDLIKIVKSLEQSGLLTKRISETINNEAKEHKRRSTSFNDVRNINC